jgi:hypothetical protein
MKFLEGKSQAERKKVIIALALGVVTICALFYTFVLSGGSPKKTPGNGNANRANTNSRNSNSGQQLAQVQPESIDQTLLTPIPDNPFPPISDGATSRNIFAFYEPPPYVPGPPKEAPPVKTPPTPTPVPPPPFLVAGLNPSTVYAQTGNFTLEVGGDKFTPESKIFFNGNELATQFTSPQRLTAQIPAQLVASDGERQIMVRVPSDPKLFSNSMIFNVQAPPVPEFNFVGLVARRRANNDTALLQNKKTKEYLSVRLNDPVPDRFRVFSISSREVVVTDTALKLRHILAFVDEKDAGKTGTGAPAGRDAIRGGVRNNPNPSFDVNNPNIQYQSIPGIPDNIPRYVPPQPVQPQQPPNKKNNDDEDDDDPNR